MVSEIVVIDRRLDQLLFEQPTEAIRLILQEYQMANDQYAFVAALAAKLVLVKAREANQPSSVGFGFTGGERFVADGAFHADRSVETAPLQHRLDPLIETRLANVVQRLRAEWIARIATFWSDIHPICKLASTDFDKRVATSLREGFFHFSQLLCGFELLLLKGQQLGVVTEESILGIEQLVVQLSNDRCHLVEVSNAESGFPEFLGGGDGADSGRNNG